MVIEFPLDNRYIYELEKKCAGSNVEGYTSGEFNLIETILYDFITTGPGGIIHIPFFLLMTSIFFKKGKSLSTKNS